jgi:hypothetical protein
VEHFLSRLYAADVELGDLVTPLDAGSVPPGRRVVQIEEVGGDSLVFHYDDGEPETYDAKTAVLVTR